MAFSQGKRVWLQYCWVFLSLLTLSFFVGADPVVKSPAFKILSTNDGLQQDHVRALLIDSDGFLWVGSEAGLDRWDGYRISPVKGDNVPFSDEAIEALFEDSKGNIWVSSYLSGVTKINRQDNTYQAVARLQYRHSPNWIQSARNFVEYEDSIVMSFYEDVIRYYPDTNTYEKLYSLTEAQIDRVESIRVAQIHNGFLFIGTTHGLIVQNLETGVSQSVEYLGKEAPDKDNQNVKQLYFDEYGYVWIGTVRGVFRAKSDAIYDAELSDVVIVSAQVMLKDRNIWSIANAKQGKFYFGTDEGLYQVSLVDEQQWTEIHILEPGSGTTSLSRNDIFSIVLDENSNLWFGSYYGGAHFWSPRTLSFSHIYNSRWADEQPLSDNSIWSFFQPNETELWIGTENGLTYYNLDNGDTEFFLTEDNRYLYKDDSSIGRITSAGGDKLYIETYNGTVLLFDMTTKQTSKLQVTTPGYENIFDLWTIGTAVDDKGRLYFIGEAFYRYDPNTLQIEKIEMPEGEHVDFTVGFLGQEPALGNRMLLSTYEHLYAIDTETLAIEHIPTPVSSRKSRNVAVTDWLVHDGILWLASPGLGLTGLDVNTFEQLHFVDKSSLLISNILYGLEVDSFGNIWFSSHSGIHVFSPERKAAKHYRYGTDLGVSEFNEYSSIKLDDGRLVYGSTLGFVMFNPDELSKRWLDVTSVTKHMAVSNVSLASRPLPGSLTNMSQQHFDLKHDDYGLTIEFSPMLIDISEQTMFRYALTLDGQVVSQGDTKDPKVTFGLLAAGNYRFEVAPVTQSIRHTILPAYITINKPYPPLQSPLAYAGYGLILISLIVSYFWVRHTQLLNLEHAQRQVKVFGDAFKQTRDCVVIIGVDRRPIASNEAFDNIFGINADQNLNSQIQRLISRSPRLERQLFSHLHGLKAGDFWQDEDTITTVSGQELDVLISISAIGEQGATPSHYLVIFSDITDRKNAERKLIKIANYDSLTGLVNRSLLLDRLEHAIQNARIHDTKLAVLFVDLDRFKGVNDSLGHDYGDKLLRVVANRMMNMVSGNDTVARFGGDEFVIVIEEVSTPESLGSFLKSLIESIETPIALGKDVVSVSCSIGVAYYPDDGQNPAELIKQADVAMYAAKKDTITAFAYFTAEMNDQAKARLHTENIVKKAFVDDTFINHYQPIVNAATGRMDGVELLLRHSAEQPLSPAQFVPILEELRYIIDVTRLSIKRAIEDLSVWYQKGFNGYVSINLSALHFKDGLDIDGIQQSLVNAGLPVSALRFELTESVLIDNPNKVSAQILEMNQAGFWLALDDFGTGYSSLSYLKRYSLQVLKIDKSFVDDMTRTKRAEALLSTTINLASSLNMSAIAEGVETAEQAEHLIELGCNLHQGYFYARPMPASDVVDVLNRNWT